VAFRFIHSADIHLDSPLKSLAIRNEKLFDLIGGATRKAFVNIVETCLTEQVDALILAGDIYDGDQTSMKTAKFFAIQMNRLRQAGIEVYIVRGNHDAETKISNQLTLPDNVKLFSGRGGSFIVPASGGSPEVAIHGISFAEPKAPTSLLPKFKARVEGAINIGVLHTSMTGADGHNTYAPCTLADLQGLGYRYWALGHIHKRNVFEGACTIVMPGNTQGRDINEAGPKTATLVTVHDDGRIELEERLTGVAEFARIRVNVDGCADWASVVAAMAVATTKAKEAARSEHLVARLILAGATSAAWELRAKPDLLKAEAETAAQLAGNVWIESIEIGCGPAASKAGAAESGDALGEIMRDITDNILLSDAFALQTGELAKELLSGLPKECQAIFDSTDENAFKAEIGRLAREGAEDVVARLRTESGKDGF
jgi:DNA repair protein SbcD/Mre11